MAHMLVISFWSNLNIGELVTPVNIKDGAETVMMEALKES